MTSRYASTFPVLNGPHGGDWIEAPPGTQAGAAVAVGFSGPRGMRYAVYVLIEVPETEAQGERGPRAAPETLERETLASSEPPAEVRPKKLGLAFVRSWLTPAEAQRHVQEISLVTNVAREVAESN